MLRTQVVYTYQSQNRVRIAGERFFLDIERLARIFTPPPPATESPYQSPLSVQVLDGDVRGGSHDDRLRGR